MATDVPVRLQLKAIDKLTAPLRKVKKGLDRVKNSVRKFSNAWENASEKTKKFRQKMNSISGGFKTVGKNLTTGVTLPVVGVGVGILSVAAKFEKGMNKVKALTQATGKDFQLLRNEAVRLGSSTKFSASQAADAMAFLAQAGFKTNEIFESTAPLLDLAAASNTDLARTADIASNVMGAFGMAKSMEETTRAANVFARATSGSNVDMSMLAETMKEAAPLAKNFGASLEETTAAAGLLGNIGIQGSKAGTALKNAFLNLSAPTGKAKKALKLLGIEVADEQGNMLKFGKIMENLGTRLAKLPQKGRLQALNLIFGKIGIAAASNLQKVAQTGELERFTKQMFNTEITASSMAKTMNQGAAGAITTLKSAMEGLAIAIAGQGENSPIFAFTSMIKKLAEFVQGLSKTDSKILTFVVVLAGLAAALGPVVTIFGTLIGMIPVLTTIATALGVSFGVVAGVAAAIPIAIAAIIGAGILLVKHWDSVKEFFTVLWTTISNNFVDAAVAIKNAFSDAMTFVGKVLTFVFGSFGKFVDRTLTKIKGMAGKAISFLPDFIKTRVGITPEFEDSLKAPDPLDKIRAKLAQKNANLQQNVVQLGERREIKRAEQPQAKNESKVTVNFENMPQGTTLKTESTDDTLFSVDTGLQASAL